MKKMFKKALAITFAAALSVTMLPMGSANVNAASFTISKPRVTDDPTNTVINANTGEAVGKKSTWDCIWYGSYPQKEVIANEAAYKANATINEAYYNKNHDVIVDAALYAKLEAATEWDANGDTVVDGIKYRRMLQKDATGVVNNENTSEDKYDAKFYKWSDATTYHYFKYEPIKWRVLDTYNKTVLVMSEEAIEDQVYNKTATATTWESSYLRKFLNNDFLSAAFTQEEQSMIKTSNVTNKAGAGYYKDESTGDMIPFTTSGGNNTQDKVFVLSNDEVRSEALGFLGGGYVDDENPLEGSGAPDKSRCCTSSTYVKALGSYNQITAEGFEGYEGYCYQWLRSPAKAANWAQQVCRLGYVMHRGAIVTTPSRGVRPVMMLDLSVSQKWSYAGTVDSKLNYNEQPYETEHSWDAGKDVKKATCVATGIKRYTCTTCGLTKDLVTEKDPTYHYGKDASGVDAHEVLKNVKEATCKEAGYTGDSCCSLCGYVFKEGTEIPKTDHKAAEAVKENVVDPTSDTEGSYDSVVYCSVCKEELSRTKVTVPATGHEHEWSAWTTTKAATAIATGSKTRSCTICGEKETATIKKLTATIKLSHKTRTLKRGRYFTLKISNLAKGDSVKSVTSSKKSVATVKKYKTNQYRITTKKKGTTTITVTLKSGKKATCKVTVK